MGGARCSAVNCILGCARFPVVVEGKAAAAAADPVRGRPIAKDPAGNVAYVANVFCSSSALAGVEYGRYEVCMDNRCGESVVDLYVDERMKQDTATWKEVQEAIKARGQLPVSSYYFLSIEFPEEIANVGLSGGSLGIAVYMALVRDWRNTNFIFTGEIKYAKRYFDETIEPIKYFPTKVAMCKQMGLCLCYPMDEKEYYKLAEPYTQDAYVPSRWLSGEPFDGRVHGVIVANTLMELLVLCACVFPSGVLASRGFSVETVDDRSLPSYAEACSISHW